MVESSVKTINLPQGSEFKLIGTLEVVIEATNLKGISEMDLIWPKQSVRDVFNKTIGDLISRDPMDIDKE